MLYVHLLGCCCLPMAFQFGGPPGLLASSPRAGHLQCLLFPHSSPKMLSWMRTSPGYKSRSGAQVPGCSSECPSACISSPPPLVGMPSHVNSCTWYHSACYLAQPTGSIGFCLFFNLLKYSWIYNVPVSALQQSDLF